MKRTDTPLQEVRVWDLPTRIFHWSLVVLVLFAMGSGEWGPEWWMGYHMASGLLVLGLVLFRVAWGFWGPEFSRFDTFVHPWRTVFQHIQGVARLQPERTPGHNPAGGWMIVALLVVLGLLGLTGLFVQGGEEGEAVATNLPYWFGHGMKKVHEGLAEFLPLMIMIHLAGVVVESLLTQENLVKAMFTGEKSLESGSALPVQRRARPIPALLVMTPLWILILGLAWYALTDPREETGPLARAELHDLLLKIDM